MMPVQIPDTSVGNFQKIRLKKIRAPTGDKRNLMHEYLMDVN
jgi:hypothetical protein